MRFLKAVLFTVLLLFSAGVFAQDSSVVKWSSELKIAGGKSALQLKGLIKAGWRIFAAPDAELELGGFTVTDPEGKIKLPPPTFLTKPVSTIDPLFAKQLSSLSDSVVVKYELPETTSSFELKLSYEAADAENFVPEKQTLVIRPAGQAAAQTTQTRVSIPAINIDSPANDCKTSSSLAPEETSKKSLLGVFLLGLAGGLVSLFLPCLFPMIPLTVSFFTNKAKSRRHGIFNASLYGFFIFIIYVAISIPFHLFEKLNPAIFNNISTNVWLNSIFFVVFVFFAFSFFGFYEITLPSRFSNRTDSKSNAGTIWGIFFMALTLTIVSFSCTGPIAGSLLAGVVGGEGGAMRLTCGMAGFGLAIGLPFALFALFPNMLKSLPKSGGWLHTVKVVLGFLELAFAFKFLSNADLVSHWGILKREIFIGAWVIIGVCLSLYLWGKIGFAADDKKPKLGWFRICSALLFTAFTLYLIPGLTNTKYANLKLISGFPPPLYYSIYAQESDFVLGLNGERSYEAGLARAKKENKKILLDFTGYACVNCRRMEENVWSTEEVYRLMKDSFIVISLYVDDKKLLPAEQRFTYKTKQLVELPIRTEGDLWSAFETENFRQNSQPLYAIIDTNEVLRTHPAGYTPDKDDYLQWLRCGLK